MILRTSLVSLVSLMAILLAADGKGFSQEADSTAVALPDSTPISGVAESTAVALPDSVRISRDAPIRYFDPRPEARLSPFSGKSVKREREDFLSLSTTTSGEAFAFEPGMELLEYGSAGLPRAFRVRGSRPGDVVYLMDGIPVSDDRLETFDLNWLPLAGMAGAEVAMNGQSGLYGSGATGGAMNLASASAMPEVPLSEVVAWWGGFDSRAIHFSFNRRVTSSLGVLLSLENLHSGGWTESSEANSNKFFGKLTGSLGRGVTYDVLGYRYDGGIELPDSCPDLSGTHPADRDDKRDFVGVSVAGGTDRSVRIDYYHIGTERDYRSGEMAGSSQGRLDGLSAVTSWATADSLTASVGAGLKRYRFTHHEDGKLSTNDIYVYAAGEKPLNDWRLRGSFRVERNSRSGTELAGDLGASFNASPWCVVFGRIDRSFAYPGLRDRSPAREFSTTDDTEHWNGLEFGADLGGEPLKLSAAFFWRNVDNSTLTVRGDACEIAPVTDKELSYLGAEALLDFAYPSWLRGSLGYSVERGRDGAGREVSCVCSGSFTWDLRVLRKFSSHISAGIAFAGRYVPPVEAGNQPVPCSETGCLRDARIDGYVSGLLYGHLDIDRGRVFARVRNLFNREMTQVWGQPELPPRTYEFGVKVELLD